MGLVAPAMVTIIVLAKVVLTMGDNSTCVSQLSCTGRCGAFGPLKACDGGGFCFCDGYDDGNLCGDFFAVCEKFGRKSSEGSTTKPVFITPEEGDSEEDDSNTLITLLGVLMGIILIIFVVLFATRAMNKKKSPKKDRSVPQPEQESKPETPQEVSPERALTPHVMSPTRGDSKTPSMPSMSLTGKLWGLESENVEENMEEAEDFTEIATMHSKLATLDATIENEGYIIGRVLVDDDYLIVQDEVQVEEGDGWDPSEPFSWSLSQPLPPQEPEIVINPEEQISVPPIVISEGQIEENTALSEEPNEALQTLKSRLIKVFESQSTAENVEDIRMYLDGSSLEHILESANLQERWVQSGNLEAHLFVEKLGKDHNGNVSFNELIGSVLVKVQSPTVESVPEAVSEIEQPPAPPAPKMDAVEADIIEKLQEIMPSGAAPLSTLDFEDIQRNPTLVSPTKDRAKTPAKRKPTRQRSSINEDSRDSQKPEQEEDSNTHTNNSEMTFDFSFK
eukprot:m.338070 g.338070  ORF g.338070 m.338070 type:complete len:506 (+) comp18307_c0_seq1:154-1671(+)